MHVKLIPGTVIAFDGGADVFSWFRPMIAATDGLSLSQVSSITGLEGATIQNWIKRGFVAHVQNKKYRERQLARILLIAALRDCMRIERIGELLGLVNGNVDDESDDIVSEEKLYTYFCEAVRRIDEHRLLRAEVEAVVEETVRDYSGPDARARQRLESALLVMVYAYLSGRFKKQAEELFEKTKDS